MTGHSLRNNTNKLADRTSDVKRFVNHGRSIGRSECACARCTFIM
jgi:hypothetical protein